MSLQFEAWYQKMFIRKSQISWHEDKKQVEIVNNNAVRKQKCGLVVQAVVTLRQKLTDKNLDKWQKFHCTVPPSKTNFEKLDMDLPEIMGDCEQLFVHFHLEYKRKSEK